MQKNLDKVLEKEKLVKKGEIKPNDDMLAKIATKTQLKQEIKDLNELCDLYIQSNPDWNTKGTKQELTQQDVQQAVSASLRQVSQVLTLSALVKDDASLVEASE